MDEEIKQLLKKNQQILNEILEISRKTKKYILLQQIFSVLKLLIIIVPIVIGLLYLPPLLKSLLDQYKSILDIGGSLPTDQLNNLGSFLR